MLLGVLPHGGNVLHGFPEKSLELGSLGLEYDELVEERNRSAPVSHLDVEAGVAREPLDALAAAGVRGIGGRVLMRAALELEPDAGVGRCQLKLDGVDLVHELFVPGLLSDLRPLGFQRLVGFERLLVGRVSPDTEKVALADYRELVELRDDDVATGLVDFQGPQGFARVRGLDRRA